jgi:hypothetical protein
LARRIRTVSGLTCHKSVVRNDIRIAAKVVMNLDEKAGFWKDEAGAGDGQDVVSTRTISIIPCHTHLS